MMIGGTSALKYQHAIFANYVKLRWNIMLGGTFAHQHQHSIFANYDQITMEYYDWGHICTPTSTLNLC